MVEYSLEHHLKPYNEQTDKESERVLEVKITSENPIRYHIDFHNKRRLALSEDLSGKEYSNRDLLVKLWEHGLRYLRCKREDDIIYVYYKEG